MLKLNGIDPGAIASIFLTSTSDLHSAFPAAAVRQILGPDIPSLCAREIEVGNAQERCIRILLHWNTEVDQTSIIPVYLNDAVCLVDSVPPEFDKAALTRWVDENVPDLEQEMLKLQKKRRNRK
jgi:chorismate mutase